MASPTLLKIKRLVNILTYHIAVIFIIFECYVNFKYWNKICKNNLWDSSIWKMRIVLTIQISGFVLQECPWVIGTWIRFKITLHFVSDFDLESECKEICHETTIECISNCTTPDSSCISKCSREEIACFNSCPCESDCPLGCVECNHSICETVRESVLVLRSVFWD